MENAGHGTHAGRTSPRVGLSGASQRPARDALRPGPGRATGKAGVEVGERRRSPRVSFRGCRCVREMGSNESNAVRTAARFSATGLMATALQHLASGLTPLPTDCRSKLKPRCRCRYLAAWPQPWESSRSHAARSSRNVEEREAGWTAPLINPMGEGIRDAVLFLSAASVVMAMRRWIGVSRPGMRYRVKRTVRSGGYGFRLGREEQVAPTPQPG